MSFFLPLRLDHERMKARGQAEAEGEAKREVSLMAASLQGSEIIQLAGEVKALIAGGESVLNYTIGDFDPSIFPIPQALLNAVIEAYSSGHTNYPSSDGMSVLRKAIAAYISTKMNLEYPADHFLVAGGGRPLIYAFYQAVLDPDEKVIFPVPSWNNNHYTHLAGGQAVAVQSHAENMFMPTAADLAPHIEAAGALALCSPLNPTGTIFRKEDLKDICQLVLDENKRRRGKPLYVLYDQIYWQLTFGESRHWDPVSVMPEMRPYTVYIDGLSKAYAATGVRVGWSFGPAAVMAKMRSILGHLGAWAPKPEQLAAAKFLSDAEANAAFLTEIREKLSSRLRSFYNGFKALRDEGYPVNAIVPQAAMYLTVKIDLAGSGKGGDKLLSQKDVSSFLLRKAGVALVPFGAFGAEAESPWYRLSVGTCHEDDIALVMERLKGAMQSLN